MDAVTYPEPAVATAIADYFVPMQVNTLDGSGTAIVERFRQVWTPDLRVLAADGYELYRWNGYLPPAEFLPQLLAARAHALLRLHDEPGAVRAYAEVLRRFPTSAIAPEAQYFQAVATYKHTHEGSDLRATWQKLQTRYPDSIWRIKQSFTEDA